ncbi:MAG: hypothetical protein DI539_31815, partial [Flavobacterium psychrophilum]
KQITGTITIAADGLALPDVKVQSMPSKTSVVTNANGKYSLKAPNTDTYLLISYLGFKTQNIKLGKQNVIDIKLEEDIKALNEVAVVGYGVQAKRSITASSTYISSPALNGSVAGISVIQNRKEKYYPLPQNTENYAHITENAFKKAGDDPLSTFSIDVDAASYSNMRRFINTGNLPPKNAVRIEEMINYFDYEYEQPKGSDPVNIVTEIGTAPWNPQHRLVHIGLQAKTIPNQHLPASNLVFLIDVSGSMESPNKLPLLVSSLRLLTDNLREQDKVAIVVYAGNSGLVLPSTSGEDKQAIKDALNKLSAGGSTAGGAGINLAYKVAADNFIKGGNN